MITRTAVYPGMLVQFPKDDHVVSGLVAESDDMQYRITVIGQDDKLYVVPLSECTLPTPGGFVDCWCQTMMIDTLEDWGRQIPQDVRASRIRHRDFWDMAMREACVTDIETPPTALYQKLRDQILRDALPTDFNGHPIAPDDEVSYTDPDTGCEREGVVTAVGKSCITVNSVSLYPEHCTLIPKSTTERSKLVKF
jgi:hypothetical protein